MKPYEITRIAYKCLRPLCGHEWTPTRGKFKEADEKPKRCPKCHSDSWDRVQP